MEGVKPGAWESRKTAEANTLEGAPKKQFTRSAPVSCAGPNAAVMTLDANVAGAENQADPIPFV